MQQKVVIEVQQPSWTDIISGVPQGWVSSIGLFSQFISQKRLDWILGNSESDKND